MYSNLFSPQSVAELSAAMQTQFPKAIWETFYVTLLSTALAVVIGLPLGVLLVAGEKDGVLPLPKTLMRILNVIINLLRPQHHRGGAEHGRNAHGDHLQGDDP